MRNLIFWSKRCGIKLKTLRQKMTRDEKKSSNTLATKSKSKLKENVGNQSDSSLFYTANLLSPTVAGGMSSADRLNTTTVPAFLVFQDVV